MSYLKVGLCTIVLATLCAPAFAINKCTGLDGKISFQDAACDGKTEKLDVKPASGKAPANIATNDGTLQANATRPMTEAQKIEAQIAASQGDRRKRELELRLVPDAFTAINQQRTQCDRELKVLQDRKARASNNLAGATWEGSISSEMTAIATRCGTRNSEVREDHAALVKECQALGGCK